MEKKKIIALMVNHKGHVPVRTCVSCRLKMDKKELIRFVRDKDDRVIIDENQKKKGRGIYLCNNISCMERFIKGNSKGFGGLNG